MGTDKNHGKIIHRLERISGFLMPQLALECTAFRSIPEYAKAFHQYYFPYSTNQKSVQSFERALRRYIKQAYGEEWYRKYCLMQSSYLEQAGVYLGVPPDRVLQHLATHAIDLAVFAREAFPDDRKAYNYFFTKIQRLNPGE